MAAGRINEIRRITVAPPMRFQSITPACGSCPRFAPEAFHQPENAPGLSLAIVKIASWNVNGLRACAKTHFRDWFRRTDADVVLVQELRAEPEQVPPDLLEMPGYGATFFPASSKKGYSGVAAWVRSSLGPITVEKGMGWDPADREGRVITVRAANLRVMGAYVFNGGKSEDAFSDKLEFWDRIREIHSDWTAQGLDVAFLGDYNICHRSIDIADPVAVPAAASVPVEV